MGEVTVLASNIEVDIKAQEQKIEQQKANEFNQFSNQLELLKKQHEGSSKKVSDIDTDHQLLMEKLLSLEKNLENRLKSLDEIDRNIQSRLSTYEETSNRRIKLVEDGNQSNQEKLVMLSH